MTGIIVFYNIMNKYNSSDNNNTISKPNNGDSTLPEYRSANSNIKEYLCGGIAGLTQVIVGYPLDTIKTNIQSGFTRTRSLTIRQLMRGIQFPMMASVASNIAFFGNYELIYQKTGSTWIAGALTGVIGSFVLNPFEIRKVRQQYINQPSALRGHSGIYGGLRYTIARETIGNAFYFSAYEFAHHTLGFNAFVSGGIAGLNSWLWSYPADVIKTRKQLDLTLTFKQLLAGGGFYKGLGIALLRGFIVNGCSFWVYDTVKNSIK